MLTTTNDYNVGHSTPDSVSCWMATANAATACRLYSHSYYSLCLPASQAASTIMSEWETDNF